MGTRSGTVFHTNASFLEALNTFNYPIVAAINTHVAHFERTWRASQHDGDIPAGFCLEAYHDIEGPYRLYQIRVGPKHGYRANILFLDRGSDAYWMYIFKKVKDRQPEDMKRARIHAQRLWNELQREEDHGKR